MKGYALELVFKESEKTTWKWLIVLYFYQMKISREAVKLYNLNLLTAWTSIIWLRVKHVYFWAGPRGFASDVT